MKYLEPGDRIEEVKRLDNDLILVDVLSSGRRNQVWVYRDGEYWTLTTDPAVAQKRRKVRKDR